MAKKEEAPEKGTQKKKSGMLKWIILAVLLLVLAGGGFFAYTYFFASDGQVGSEGGVEVQGEKKSKDDGVVNMVSMPSFVVNLADPLGRRYLKISLEMELVGKDAPAKFQKEMPKIKDKLLLLLSSKSYSDLSSMAAKVELKTEIVNRANLVLGENIVKQVFYTEFIIQ